MRWKYKSILFFILSFLKLLGNINEMVLQNSVEYLINFKARVACLPNGGLPIIWICLFKKEL